MTNEFEQLARRAVVCKAWRWMAGMRVFYDSALFGLGHPSRIDDDIDASMARCGYVATLPDFADRVTLGGLEGLVCDAWDAEVMVLKEVIRSGPHAGKVSHRVAIFQPERSVDWGWTERYLFETAPGRAFRPVSRAEALVAALEAAPAREVKS